MIEENDMEDISEPKRVQEITKKKEEKKKKQNYTAFYYPQRILIGLGASLMCGFLMACGSYLITILIVKKITQLQTKLESIMVIIINDI